ncbi:MAG: CooT family nickel-binding protein [Candidatus Helarchaeota archaeon]
MCEFKLKMLENDNEKEISENILYSTIEDDKLIFRNILGMTTSVENAMIIEISVLSEKILLLKSDLMPYVYKLIQLQNSGASDQDIKDAWIKLKEMGNKLFIK